MTDDVKTAQALKEIEEKMKRPAWLELLNLVAQEKFLKFRAYQRAGFDARQALEMVIREGGQ